MSIDERVDPGLDVDVGVDVADFGVLAGAERDAAFLEVERRIRRLRALQAEMISAVTSNGSFVDDGHHTPRAWVQAVLNSSRNTAVELVRTAALSTEVPGLADDARAGRVGADQLRELGRAWANPRCRSQMSEHGAVLVPHARRLRFEDFRRVMQRWIAHADPDGAHRDHETSRANRSVRFHHDGTGGVLHAEGDALTMEIITDVVRAHAEAEFHADVAERAERFGDQADQHPLRRTAPQRWFDALHTICLKAAGVRDTGVVAPTVNIMTTEADLTDAIRHHIGQTTEPGRAWNANRRSETDRGTPVDRDDLVTAALLGTIRRVIVSNDGRVIDLGRRQRLFTGAAREAVLLTGRCCSHPGCDRDGPSVHIDHIEEWHRNGATNPFNAGPKCPIHNRDKHHHRYTVTHDETGWHHYRPDGTEIAPRGT